MSKTVSDLVMEYFQSHPKQDLNHGPVVDWVEEQYLKLYKKKPRDTWRAIRRLYQEGKLIKVKKGVYRFDPDHVRDISLPDFPHDVKQKIFRRDKYRCVICGLGRKDDLEICADHKRPLDKGGTNTVDNGQTLCTQHNLMKKNYSQTEAGKKYFIKFYEGALEKGDEKMIKFCQDVFNAYNKHQINTHIPRPNSKRKT